MTGSSDREVTVIGIIVRDHGGASLVPRRTHQDGTEGQVPDAKGQRFGIRLTGSVPVTDPEAVVALRGTRDEKSFRVSATRTTHVGDVFTQHAPVEAGAASVFARPSVTRGQGEWEIRMLRGGELVSRRYVRAVDGSWRVVVAAQNIERVRPQLERAYGDQLTLVELDWSRQQVDAARNLLTSRMGEWKIMVILDGTSAEGVGVLRVSLWEVTREVSEWYRTLPPSMVELFPFIVESTEMEGFDDDSRDYSHRQPQAAR